MPPLTHAGGVVTSQRDGGTTFLIVRASRPPYDWVLPKGHIEEGETPEKAAQREVLEETGVVAEIVAPLGDVEFDYKRREIHVRYFLMRARDFRAAAEDRETRWCSYAEADRLLSFDTAREVLSRAAAI